MPLSEHVSCVAIPFKMTEWVEQRICIKFCVKLENSSVETIWMIQKATAVGNWWFGSFIRTMHPLMHHVSLRSQGAYFEGDWGVIVLCTMFLVSYIFFNKFFFFILHAGYSLHRPHMSVKWKEKNIMGKKYFLCIFCWAKTGVPQILP